MHGNVAAATILGTIVPYVEKRRTKDSHTAISSPPPRTAVSRTKAQCASGTDSVASAPYARSRCYMEYKVYPGPMWLDPGEQDPNGTATKQVRSTAEFAMKDEILSGRVRHF